MTKDQPTLPMNDGHSIPQFGLGVFQTPKDETARVVTDAIAAGYHHVDTAAGYGNEEGVGEALHHHADVFVTTKLANSEHGYDETMRAFEVSATKLRRPTLDLYLVHWPRPRVNRYVETWKAFVQLQKDGRIKSIGVSNFNPDHLERIIDATGVVPAVNQIELHPKFQQRALRAVHEKLGILTESWSPIGRGALLGDGGLQAIAGKHGCTVAQVIIRWHLDKGLIVIPKTVNQPRLVENIRALDITLDAEDTQRIDAMDAADGRIGPDPETATF